MVSYGPMVQHHALPSEQVLRGHDGNPAVEQQSTRAGVGEGDHHVGIQ